MLNSACLERHEHIGRLMNIEIHPNEVVLLLLERLGFIVILPTLIQIVPTLAECLGYRWVVAI